jgi:hypothetical protein
VSRAHRTPVTTGTENLSTGERSTETTCEPTALEWGAGAIGLDTPCDTASEFDEVADEAGSLVETIDEALPALEEIANQITDPQAQEAARVYIDHLGLFSRAVGGLVNLRTVVQDGRELGESLAALTLDMRNVQEDIAAVARQNSPSQAFALALEDQRTSLALLSRGLVALSTAIAYVPPLVPFAGALDTAANAANVVSFTVSTLAQPIYDYILEVENASNGAENGYVNQHGDWRPGRNPDR